MFYNVLFYVFIDFIDLFFIRIFLSSFGMQIKFFGIYIKILGFIDKFLYLFLFIFVCKIVVYFDNLLI